MVKLRLLEACKIGDFERVQNDTAVQPNLVDTNGAGCLHYAARGGSLEIAKYLVNSAGFSPLHRSNTGSTALHDAAARGNTAIVKWLVDECALNVDDQDGVGITALHVAARYCHPLTVEWLLDEGCADEKIRSGSGAIPLFFAVVGGDLNCVKMLMDENPRLVNMQLNNGATPLYIACQNGLLDIAKYLHSRNGATKIKAYDGMSCLHAAAQLGYLELVKWLVTVGECNPNDRDFDGATPVHYAASRGHSEVVKWLLAHGGARVTLDNIGGSPLHSAAEMGELQAVGALLDCGCDVTLVDNQGLTAAELADKCDQPEAAALIRKEVTLDQLLVEEDLSDQVPQRPSELFSPALNFPPPPPYSPEEEPEENQFVNSLVTDNNNHAHHPNPHPEQANSALLDSPSTYPPPPPPPVLHDSPLRGREFTPTPPPPPPPPPLSQSIDYAPPTSAPRPAPVGDWQEALEPEEEVFHRSASVAQAHSAALGNSYYSGDNTQGQPFVRRTISKASVNSSTSDLAAFEVTTVVADVHKSRGSIDSVSAVQPVPLLASNSVTSAIAIRSVSVSNSVPKDTSQYRKFSVLKHVPQNTGIQEKPELEANSNSNNNHDSDSDHFAVNRRRQRTPTPPPLSPGSESVNSVDTLCSNLQPQDTQDSDLPPPPPPLPAHSFSLKSQETSAESFPPLPADFVRAQSSSLYEELPPPPQPSATDSQVVGASQDFPAPPSLAHLAIASRPKQNPPPQGPLAEKAASTSNFKEYFDSGTRANFARAKALFGATFETNTEPKKDGLSNFSSRGREVSPRPSKSRSSNCINPDSGEEEICTKSQESGSDQNRQKGFLRPSRPSNLQMDSTTQNDSNGPVSPALSGHSGDSSLSQDSVRSVVNDQGAHVTIISTSSASEAGEKVTNGALTPPDKKPNGTSASAATNSDPVKAPVPIASSNSNNVVMREGSGGAGRAGARIVVSAGPEILSKPNVQNGRPYSTAQPTSPPITKNKNDLIADIQSAVSGTSNLSLRRAKSRGEGVSMVYSSKRNSAGQDQSKMTDTTRPLTGDFDPKNFLDKVETVDATGRAIPEWRRNVLAKHAAEKAQKDFEEKRVVEDYESRFKDMPAWKRALIERREAQAREEEAANASKK